MDSKIGAKIKNFLDKKSIKYNFLSDVLQVKQCVITAILADKRKLSFDEYVKITKSLQVPLDYFIKDKETEKE